MSALRTVLVVLALATRAVASPLTVREAVTTAVRTSPQLAGARLDVAVAEARVAGAEGATDWLFTTDAKLDASRTPQLASSGTVAVSAGLTRPLPGGGSIGIVADGQVTRDQLALTGATAAAVPARSWSSTKDLLVVIRQPLLRGWNGDTAPRTLLARTRASRDITELEAATTAGDAIRDVVRAYWEVGAARDELAIRRASLALAEEQARVTRARIDSGKVSASEGLAVGQAIAVRRDELAQAEASLVHRSAELRRRIGVELSVAAYDVAPADPEMADPDLDRELALAIERNAELATVHARGAAASIEVDVTANGLLPALDLSVTAGPRSTTTGSLVDGAGATVELQLSVPIGNRAAAGAHLAASRELRRVRYGEAELRAQVASAVIDAVTTMRTARTRADALGDAIRLGDEAIAAELERWQQGKSTNYDVMKRQAERADSALRWSRAVADYLEAEAALDALTGAILPRYGVAVR